ncbi:chromosome partition protein Smc [mine drainage metagenome]|uniref:Chromosome partition protein Smc n=1 Tax=mine drainage metagenome TaxID=410659 RepID=A0A1J5Q080_9ZZZZ
MLELVVSEKQNMPATTGPGNLPQTVTPPGVPSTEVRAEENRMRDIMRIQQDLVRRRRRRTLLLVARLAFFVLLPSFLAGYYYYVIATPFYNATAAFVINQSNGASASALGGLFSGTQFATSQDAITVQNYLQSRDAMLRLDKDQGFKKVFSAPNIDPLQRLATPATNEAAYKIYTRNVNVGYDPTEGIIRLDVTSPDPNQSVIFAKALISYAEQQVDSMTKRMRDDQMKGAQQSYNDAEAKLEAANRAVVALQTKYKVMSSDVEVSLISSQIGALQTELTKDTLDLAAMKSTSNPVQARIDPLQQRVDEVNRQIAALRAQMTQNDGHGESLAEIQGQLLAAQADVQTRQLMLSTTLQALESARITANQQTRYLSVGVQPVAADDPSFPRAFEDTIVAFLIFAGLYLILSMTASILKEQVSS